MNVASKNNVSGFEQSLSPEFKQVLRSMRKILPYLAVGFLIFVYGVSAWIGGSLLMKLTDALMKGIILAFCINTAIQVGRMLLVFYPLLNPARPTLGYNGEITGIALGAVSVFEIWTLVAATGMHHALATSASILMVIGVLAEVYFLREIKFNIKMELLNNPSYWNKIIKSKIAEKQFEQLMDKVENGDVPDIDMHTFVEQVLPSSFDNAKLNETEYEKQNPELQKSFDISKVDDHDFFLEVKRRHDLMFKKKRDEVQAVKESTRKMYEDDEIPINLPGKEAAKANLESFDLGNVNNPVRLNGVPVHQD